MYVFCIVMYFLFIYRIDVYSETPFGHFDCRNAGHSFFGYIKKWGWRRRSEGVDDFCIRADICKLLIMAFVSLVLHIIH